MDAMLYAPGAMLFLGARLASWRDKEGRIFGPRSSVLGQSAIRAMIKRSFDVVAAGLGLFVLSPVLLATAILIKLDSRGPVFFKQERIGKGFRPFLIYKFRTMTQGGSPNGSLVTVKGDSRITPVGRILRKTKIDELPQLINVLKGEMTIVGPRPEMLRYIELFKKDYEEILTVCPGITDLASLKYRDEESVLAERQDPHEAYVTEVLPDKICLAKEYARQSSFWSDLRIIFGTLLKLVNLAK